MIISLSTGDALPGSTMIVVAFPMTFCRTTLTISASDMEGSGPARILLRISLAAWIANWPTVMLIAGNLRTLTNSASASVDAPMGHADYSRQEKHDDSYVKSQDSSH